MKKIVLLFSALIFAGLMQAQLHFGPQIGFTTSKLSTNTSDIKSEFKSNFLFGAFARIGDKIYVQPEVNWLTQGGVWENDYSTIEEKKELEMKYKTIQIPVSVGWRLIDLKLVNIRVFGGLAANIVTDKDIKVTNITEPIENSDWKDMIWQYQLGAGVDVLMFAVDVKYMGGLNDLSNDLVFDGKTIETKSNLFMVTLGWKIF